MEVDNKQIVTVRETRIVTRHFNENGELHQEDGPAIEVILNTAVWYKADNLYGIDGPEYFNVFDRKEWWVNNKRHRTDGPAVEWADGSKEWYIDDRLHRLDGPAVIDTNGNLEWWVNGEYVGHSAAGFTDEKFEQWKKENLTKEVIK